jgi:hypothetical protein
MVLINLKIGNIYTEELYLIERYLAKQDFTHEQKIIIL